mmetsp:Transcript_27398/g.58179  ORF Transcript_27398/g.58179 Transcript_27398/m.58179 type:complete len:243 (+) Transcript_27398:130-858(+)
MSSKKQTQSHIPIISIGLQGAVAVPSVRGVLGVQRLEQPRLLLLLLGLLVQLGLVPQVGAVEGGEVARREGVDDDEHVEREGVLGHLEHALDLALVRGRADVAHRLEDGDEGRGEEVGEELLDDEDRILAQGVHDFDAQLGRERLQGTRQHGHDEEVEPQIASRVRVQVDVAHGQGERPEDEHGQNDEVVLPGVVRPAPEHEAGAHDEHLERPAHDAHVLPPRTVERDEVVHERGEGVDDDA